jgi:hypothetical protein
MPGARRALSEPVHSPELALVDPELARVLRARLPGEGIITRSCDVSTLSRLRPEQARIDASHRAGPSYLRVVTVAGVLMAVSLWLLGHDAGPPVSIKTPQRATFVRPASTRKASTGALVDPRTVELRLLQSIGTTPALKRFVDRTGVVRSGVSARCTRIAPRAFGCAVWVAGGPATNVSCGSADGASWSCVGRASSRVRSSRRRSTSGSP